MPANREVPLVARRALGGPYVLLAFRHPEVANEGRAGQFVMIKAGTSSAPPLRRPFSIMAVDPDEDTFTLFLKVVGGGSSTLAAMAEGGLAQCVGPLGRPFTVPPGGHEALLVAGGYGIAPFHLFTRELAAQGLPARLFYGGRTAADLQARDGFAERGVPLTLTTNDGSLGEEGLVTGPLERHLDARPGPATLYACGPDPMLHAVAQLASRRGLPAQVSLDPWMGCGMGACLGCVVWVQGPRDERPRYSCACTKGPVYDASEVVWPGERASLARRGAAS